METQKIVNLLNDSNNENSKFATKKWYIIDSEAKGNYLPDNEINFLTSLSESSICADTSGRLWQFKRDEIDGDVNLTVDAQHIPNNSSSFKYKSSFITNRNGVKIVVPLKYSSNFWRLLEIPLINCKVEFSLKSYQNCILSSARTAATFAITDLKLYVPVATFKIEDNTKLSKLLSEGFKRSVYWNICEAILRDHA